MNRIVTKKLLELSIPSHVTVAGWVSKTRHHGGVLFIELRDRFGTIQCVLIPAQLHLKFCGKYHNQYRQ